ncbi:tetratricopeptide repeat protein [Azospirillum sp.]|uniref:tetratricopeptide repeat protein n=1 Tax=Azospirillum sp. TaxID=34012 RepID=UPI002D5DF086|nr:tetratricopeptide repeat protein [Azospirillum sp.]HYD68411.1 tetratricopeptide repeat protein [Azospirillum sp.]
MRSNLLVVLLVLAVGIGISLLLIPRGGELALQRFRDQDFEAARAGFEARFAAGDHGPGTVMPLAKLYMQDGNVARAAELIEAYVAREPGQIEARELLGKLYRDAQRLGDYLENLEEIAVHRPTEDVFRELVGFYAFHGDYDKQAEALKRLVALRPDDRDAAVDLGKLLAVRDRHAEAAEVLAAIDDRAEGAIDFDGRELLLSLLMDLGREEEAMRRAGRWLAGEPPAHVILALTGMMMEIGRADFAHRLIEPFAARAVAEPVLALTLIDLQIADNRLEDARRALQDWWANRPVDDAAVGRFAALALNAGLPKLALEAARPRDPHLIPDWALVGLADAAFREGDRVYLDRLVRGLGDRFLERLPLLGGEIALARGDRAAAARWAESAAADADAPLADRLAAVRMLVRVERKETAGKLFAALPLAGGDVPDELLEDLGTLFADLDRVAEGFRWFAARRTAKPSLAADLGWVRLAVRAGDPAEVAAWLDAQRKLDDGLLQDIASVAVERGAVPLALKAAERVFAAAPTPRSRLALVNALLAAKRPGDALPHLRALLGEDLADVRGLYLAALDAAGAGEELEGYVTQLLAAGTMGEAEADGMVYLLLDRKAFAAALPFLRERAERRGVEWVYAYADAAGKAGRAAEAGAVLAAHAEGDPERWWAMAVETLRQAGRKDMAADLLERLLKRPELAVKTREAMAFALLEEGGPARALPALKQLAEAAPAGPWDGMVRDALGKLNRRDELRAWLLARAGDGRMPVKERRELAFALLEMGEKKGAEATFQKLAVGQGPDGPDVRQLFYLWGPRPPAGALDWIEARAKAAKEPAEQAAWYAKLAESGGASRVIGAVAQRGAAPDGKLRGSYIEALAADGKAKALGEAVRAAVPGERDPEVLRRWARLAEAQRESAAAEAAWKALLALKPDDADGLRQVGMLAYDQGHLAEAERALRRFLAKGEGDYEANYFLGEALTAAKRTAEALPFYRRALQQIEALPAGARNDGIKQAQANILHRVGRVDDSVALFEELRRRRPTDNQLRADYAAMLIENRRLKEAQHVLKQD